MAATEEFVMSRATRAEMGLAAATRRRVEVENFMIGVLSSCIAVDSLDDLYE